MSLCVYAYVSVDICGCTCKCVLLHVEIGDNPGNPQEPTTVVLLRQSLLPTPGLDE